MHRHRANASTFRHAFGTAPAVRRLEEHRRPFGVNGSLIVCGVTSGSHRTHSDRMFSRAAVRLSERTRFRAVSAIATETIIRFRNGLARFPSLKHADEHGDDGLRGEVAVEADGRRGFWRQSYECGALIEVSCSPRVSCLLSCQCFRNASLIELALPL